MSEHWWSHTAGTTVHIYFRFKVTWWCCCFSVCSHLLSFIYQKQTFHLNISVLLLLLMSFVVTCVWVCICHSTWNDIAYMYTYTNIYVHYTIYMCVCVWLKIDFSFFRLDSNWMRTHLVRMYAQRTLAFSLSHSIQPDYEISIPITTTAVRESMRSMRRMRMFLMGLIMLQMAWPWRSFIQHI